MLLNRIIWVALGVALLVGSAQTVLHQWQAIPILLAAEAFEDRKVTPAAPHVHPRAAESQVRDGHHRDAAAQRSPASTLERALWTWVANVLHGFSMALLVCTVMSFWVWLRGISTRPMLLGLGIAAAGWLTFHFWPSLGLPAEIPGMDAARLGSRQAWWALAAAAAALACGTMAVVRTPLGWSAALALLAAPYVVGPPPLDGDPLSGFGPEAQLQLRVLGSQFVFVTTCISVTLWLNLGVTCGWCFRRWLQAPLASLGQQQGSSRYSGATTVQTVSQETLESDS